MSVNVSSTGNAATVYTHFSNTIFRKISPFNTNKKENQQQQQQQQFVRPFPLTRTIQPSIHFHILSLVFQ